MNLRYRDKTICGICIAAAMGGLSAMTESGPWPRHTIDNTSRGADGVKLADANGDGRMDIITGWEEGGVTRIYLNPGPTKVRKPWPRVQVGAVRSPEDAVLADLDGDGVLDALSATEGNERTIFVHWAPRERACVSDAAAWSTEVIPTTLKKQMWMFLLPFDVDGRDGKDVITGSKNTGGAIGWLQVPADARALGAWQWHALRPAGWIMSLIAADLDGDGRPDILYSDRKGRKSGVGWLRNPGTDAAARGVAWEDHLLAAHGREVMFLDYADVNGDERPDIAAAVKPSNILLLHAAAGGGWREEWIEVKFKCGRAKAVKIADLDRDGRADLIYSCEGAEGSLPGIVWLRRESTGWEARNLGGPAGVKFDLIATLDLDGDGDQDVITCEERDNLGVFWYENPTK